MNLDNITIHKFKSLYNVHIPLKRINIFAGENDSGKSTILRAINEFLSFNEFSENDKTRIIDKDNFTGQKADNKIIITGTFRFSSDDNISYFENNTTRNEVIGIKERNYIDFTFSRNNSGNIYAGSKRVIKSESVVPRCFLIDTFKSLIHTDEQDTWAVLQSSILQLIDSSDDLNFVKTVLRSYLGDWWTSAGNILSIEGTPDNREINYTETTGIYGSLYDKGTGFQMFLFLIVSILLEYTAANREKRNSIILIDEPERMLHPAAQRKFIDLINDIVKHNPNINFMISTHSSVIIKNNNVTTINLVEKDAQGKTQLNKKAYQNNWAAVRNSLGMTLSDSLIIGEHTFIVEGVCEQLCFPILLQKFYPDLEIDKIFFFNACGAGEVPSVLKLLDQRRLLTNVNIILDSDDAGDEAIKTIKSDKKAFPYKSIMQLNSAKIERTIDKAFEDMFNEEWLYEALNIFHKDDIARILEKNDSLKKDDVEQFVQTKDFLKNKPWAYKIEKYFILAKKDEIKFKKVDLAEWLVQKSIAEDECPEVITKIYEFISSNMK